MKRLLVIMLVIAVVAVIALKGRRAETHVLVGRAMGTEWKLVHSGGTGLDLHREVAAELEFWEQVLSQWRPNSDLSRYNRGEAITTDLLTVLTLANQLKEETGGTFDPNMLAEVHGAGFGPGGSGLDLSAIGKGFAVDRVGGRLRALGVSHFVFEFGGEILAGEGEWEVAIESPVDLNAHKRVSLSRRAVATSGNYQQFRNSESGLISHIIDPRSGKSVMRPPLSVTVFADDCATADAWATALFVLGPGEEPDEAPEFFWHGQSDLPSDLQSINKPAPGRAPDQ